MKAKEIEIKDIWNDKKRDDLKEFISVHSKNQTKERLLKNKLLSIQYQLEDYIQNENEGKEILKVLDFVKMYLKVLNISKKELAAYFEMKDSNLQKYLSGERKLNAEIVLKLSAFSHTKPEQWFSIQIKNELIKLKQDHEKLKSYVEKYDYRNLIEH